MKSKWSIFILFSLIIIPLFSGESLKMELKPANARISGMMMIHGGYLKIGNISGFSSGVGGKMTYNLTPFFRIGTEGHSSSSTYDDAGSYFSLGWGGATFELMVRRGIFQFAGGVTVGGGSISHLQYISGTNSDTLPDQVLFQSYAVFLFTPTLSFEFFIKEHMAVVLKSDYLMGLPGKIADGMTTGPKLYLGIMFQK